MFIIGPNSIDGDPEAVLDRLERLLHDVQALAAGHRPGAAELRGAPILESFRISTRDVPCLVGQGTDHPLLGNGPVVTSEVWAIAHDLTWARTLSRWYRLGARRPGWRS